MIEKDMSFFGTVFVIFGCTRGILEPNYGQKLENVFEKVKLNIRKRNV